MTSTIEFNYGIRGSRECTASTVIGCTGCPRRKARCSTDEFWKRGRFVGWQRRPGKSTVGALSRTDESRKMSLTPIKKLETESQVAGYCTAQRTEFYQVCSPTQPPYGDIDVASPMASSMVAPTVEQTGQALGCDSPTLQAFAVSVFLIGYLVRPSVDRSPLESPCSLF